MLPVPLMIAAAALVAVVVVITLFPKRLTHGRIPLWAAIGSLGVLLGGVLGYAAAEFLGLHWPTRREPPPPTPVMMMGGAGGPASPLLPSGAKFPSLNKNWLNGPPRFGDERVKLIVVDFWAHWCPFCRYAAPRLVEIYPKYKERGVQFVSFSIMPRDVVESFVGQFKIEWPFMYETPKDFVDAAGAGGGTGINSGQAVLYIIAPTGEVLWNDERGRLMHEPTDQYIERVSKALDELLAKRAQTAP
ncbi:MAG TPA: TlpA disulfide reductase family protein [Candidatus Binatia bacterium]|nr:TlpA disulfide reductase family protein [Candidatus Binatia bacterium]